MSGQEKQLLTFQVQFTIMTESGPSHKQSRPQRKHLRSFSQKAVAESWEMEIALTADWD